MISVITIFLNGERFLAEAIESVLAQTRAAWKLFLDADDVGRPDKLEIQTRLLSVNPGASYRHGERSAGNRAQRDAATGGHG